MVSFPRGNKASRDKLAKPLKQNKGTQKVAAKSKPSRATCKFPWGNVKKGGNDLPPDAPRAKPTNRRMERAPINRDPTSQERVPAPSDVPRATPTSHQTERVSANSEPISQASPSQNSSFYDFLGVQKDATPSEIDQAFRRVSCILPQSHSLTPPCSWLGYFTQIAIQMESPTSFG